MIIPFAPANTAFFTWWEKKWLLQKLLHDGRLWNDPRMKVQPHLQVKKKKKKKWCTIKNESESSASQGRLFIPYYLGIFSRIWRWQSCQWHWCPSPSLTGRSPPCGRSSRTPSPPGENDKPGHEEICRDFYHIGAFARCRCLHRPQVVPWQRMRCTEARRWRRLHNLQALVQPRTCWKPLCCWKMLCWNTDGIMFVCFFTRKCIFLEIKNFHLF